MITEQEINSFIAEVKAEANLIRVYQNDPIELTNEQEDDVKKHKESEREEIRKKYMEEAKEHRKARVLLLLYALEDKIKGSDLPPQIKEELANVFDKIKNTDVNFTPDKINQIQEILDKTGEEKKAKSKEETEISLAAPIILGATAAMAAPIIVSSVQEETQKAAPVRTMDYASGVPMLGDHADPIYAQKALAVGQKVLAKIENNGGFKQDAKEDPFVTLAKVASAENTSNAERNYGMMAYVEENPELKEALKAQYEVTSKQAREHSIADYEIKKAEGQAKQAKAAVKSAKTEEERKDAIQLLEKTNEVLAQAKQNKEEAFPSHIKKEEGIKEKLSGAHDHIVEAKILLNQGNEAMRNAKTAEERAAA